MLKSLKTTKWLLSDSIFETDWIVDKRFRNSGN